MSGRPENRIYLFAWELASMGEYSCSLPTATTPWKMWKRNLVAYALPPENRPPQWRVGQYLPSVDGVAPIRWFRVVLKQGPKPLYYAAPDWSNYDRWKRDREPRPSKEVPREDLSSSGDPERTSRRRGGVPRREEPNTDRSVSIPTDGEGETASRLQAKHQASAKKFAAEGVALAQAVSRTFHAANLYTVLPGEPQMPRVPWVLSLVDGSITYSRKVDRVLRSKGINVSPWIVQKDDEKTQGRDVDDIDAAVAAVRDGATLVKVPDTPNSYFYRFYVVDDEWLKQHLKAENEASTESSTVGGTEDEEDRA